MAEAGYPRDLRGYGRNPPDPKWPGNARVAVQFVVNFEEGGENSILHGDRASEAFLSDVLGAQPWPGQRHANIESMHEYGSRAGFWRLWRIFTERFVKAQGFKKYGSISKKLAQLESIGRRGALLIVIEIDKYVTALLFPRFDTFSPIRKRVGAIMPFVVSLGPMPPHIDEIGGALPWRWRIMMIGQAE